MSVGRGELVGSGEGGCVGIMVFVGGAVSVGECSVVRGNATLCVPWILRWGLGEFAHKMLKE